MDILKNASGESVTLTPREREVFQLLLKGMKEKEIAGALHISRSGVGFFTKRIYKKLDVNSKPELILRYYNFGGSKEGE